MGNKKLQTIVDKRIKKVMKNISEVSPSEIEKDMKKDLKDFNRFIKEEDIEEAALSMTFVTDNILYSGQQKIIKGNPGEGWEEVERSSYQMIVAYAFFGIRASSVADDVGLSLLFFIAADRRYIVEFGSKALEVFLSKGHDRFDANIGSFAYWCCKKYLKKKPRKSIALHKPYDQIADTFDDVPSEKTIRELIEFHLNNMGLYERDGVDYLGFYLIPVEFFALSMLYKGNPYSLIEYNFEFFTTPYAMLDLKALTYEPEKDKILKLFIELAIRQKLIEPDFLKKLKS